MSEHSPLSPGTDGRCGVLLYSKVSVYGAVLLCLNLILLSILYLFYQPVYVALMEEDSLFESSTAFLFLLTALLLLAITARGRGVPGRWLYLLGALAFVFAAGEEINWGQRIFGFETPNFLHDISVTGEFNVHHIDAMEGVFRRSFRVGMMLLCVATSAAYFAQKKYIFLRVPFPSILTMCCFLVVYAYRSRDLVGTFPLSIVLVQHLLLLLFIAYACFSKQRQLLTLSAFFLAVIFLEQVILRTFVDKPVHDSIWEGYEYLFSIACAVYAGELFSHSKRRFAFGESANRGTRH